MTGKIFKGKVFLLVTGASQGIGRKIAEVLGSTLESGSLVLLLARNAENLKGTADNMPKTLAVEYRSVDLSKATAEELRSIIDGALVKDSGADAASKFDEIVVVHNVGSIGDVTKFAVDMTDFDYWRQYYDLNVFSPAVLNGVFMNVFKGKNIKRHVINITSACGIQPFNSMGYYCSGKAAREMYFKVFAKENPDVNVLNYSPGPVDTEMLDTVTDNIVDPTTKEIFKDLKENERVLTTDQTVKKFLDILSSKKYESGDHVDYYDEL
ncbi:sepiapterin reductase-like [Copidosoma floridanum]|uniref:sepiapterin reductase-like n=1 Tax=Copidosoma floridanum TaxID=29053 RepID=UPI0006C94BDD|nr:sepiapterin reductase-like [Copidosoma floridanum]